jgi:hypothetical protein
MRRYRAEPRKSASGTAELHWQIGAGYMRSTLAAVQDVSSSGMGLHSSVPFAIGSILQIKIESQMRVVTVRRCFPQDGLYFLGVEFYESPPEGNLGSAMVIPKTAFSIKKHHS